MSDVQTLTRDIEKKKDGRNLQQKVVGIVCTLFEHQRHQIWSKKEPQTKGCLQFIVKVQSRRDHRVFSYKPDRNCCMSSSNPKSSNQIAMDKTSVDTTSSMVSDPNTHDNDNKR